MAPRLNIIMPVSRPHNLGPIMKCYLHDMEPHGFEIRWLLMVQGPEADPKGYRKSNEGSRMVTTGWNWYASDDSMQAASLFAKLGQTVRQNPDALAIVFSEKRKGVCPWTGGAWPTEPKGILLAAPGNMKRCRVDCTQVFFHASLTPFFDFEAHGDEADGALIESLWSRFPEKFVFVPDHFVFFGSLDP